MSVLAILKKSYKDIYDNILQVIMVSMFWFFTAGLLVLSSIIGVQSEFFLPALLALLLTGPITVGCFYMINRSINYKTVVFTDLLVGIKKFFIKSLVISLIGYGLIFICIFYSRIFLNSEYMILNLLTAFWYYMIFAIIAVAVYIFPVLIEFEESDKETSLKNLFKTTAVLILKDIKLSSVVFLNMIIFSLAVIILMLPLPVLFIGTIALFSNNVIINLLVKNGLKEDVRGPYSFKGN